MGVKILYRRSLLILFFVLLMQNFSYGDTGFQGVLLSPEKSINVHRLIDQDGKTVQFPSVTGKFQLVFFGYTSCPDICPTTLHKIKNVMNSLKQREDIEFYFISIDSNRDNPKQIKEFLEFFHPDIKGLTGSIKDIKKVENEFGILTRKFQGKSAFAYKLEHSVFMYLLNKQGKLMLMYPGSTTSMQLVSDLTTLLASKEM